MANFAKMDQSVTTKSILEAESRGALKALREGAASGLFDDEDSSVIFESFTVLHEYATHLRAAFNHPNAIHAVAVKTNPHKEVLRALVSWGFGLEAASFEELLLAKSAGIAPENLVFDGPVKTTKEIAKCNEMFPGLNINVNCLEELDRFPSADKCTLKLGIRVNPMVDTGAPAVYHVSGDDSKFGTPVAESDALLEAIMKYNITTLHVHAGSSMKYLDQSVLAVKKVFDLAQTANSMLAAEGSKRRIDCIDMGGGLLPEVLSGEAMAFSRSLHARKREDNAPISTMHTYATLLRKEMPELFSTYRLITEFGQWVHFYCGFAVSEVEYVVAKKNKSVMYIHLGADFFMRDVYTGKSRDASLQVLTGDVCLKGTLTAAAPAEGGRVFEPLFDVAGPLCVAGDYLKKDLCLIPAGGASGGDKRMNNPVAGDLLVLLGTGSNSYGMWSRHCSRTIPKVVGVGSRSHQELTSMNLAEYQSECEGRAPVEVLSKRWNPFLDHAEVDLRPEENV
jgi:diaminopimelate decarboxylase